MIPKGFFLGGVKEGKYGLGIVKSQTPSLVSVMFTKNKVVGAHIPFDRKQLGKSNSKCTLIAVNSGNANACTRSAKRDAKKFAKLASIKFSPQMDETLVASTGVIGEQMKLELISSLFERVSIGEEEKNVEEFAKAIMTTDKKMKIIPRELSNGIRILAIAKGSGMVFPNMATMLCFILTDGDFEKNFLDSALKDAVEHSLNSITIDGDTSPNDSVFLLSNGEAKNKRQGDMEFRKALKEVCDELALMIVRDGEGVVKVMEIEVVGEKNEERARNLAFAIGNSPLVKTAIHGEDENWGRILSTCGNNKIPKPDIWVGGELVVEKGILVALERKGLLKEDLIKIKVNAGKGNGNWTILAGDLSKEYVEINAHYKT